MTIAGVLFLGVIDSINPSAIVVTLGVRKMLTAERKAVVGWPDLESLTTSHIERAFLTVREELKRFQRKGLGYSKDLETHRLAVAMRFGIYNFVVHKTPGTTPAVAADVEYERWSFRTGR